MKLLFLENYKIAFKYIQGNLLRTVLTISIIVIGIMALVGTLTAIEGIKSSIIKNFSAMGSNVFSIQNRDFFSSAQGRRKEIPNITYQQAKFFKDKFEFPSLVSINYTPMHNATVKYKSKKTNPQIRVLGTDENYLFLSNLSIIEGRNFSNIEIQYGAHVAIIGSSLKKSLFGEEINMSFSAG